MRFLEEHPILSLMIGCTLSGYIFGSLLGGVGSQTANAFAVLAFFAPFGLLSNSTGSSNNNTDYESVREYKSREAKRDQDRKDRDISNRESSPKHFKVSYFLKNSSYNNLVTEYVGGGNIFEVQARYHLNPIVDVKRGIQVVEIIN
jgi:hypothetical protein